MSATAEDRRFRRGNQFHPDAISPEEFLRIEDVFRHDAFHVDFADVVREGKGLKAVLEVSWRTQTVGNDGTSQEQSRTLAYFDRPGMPTPAFTLAPSSGAAGFMQGMIAGISGLGVNFSDLQEFDRTFSVMSFFPRSTRALLNEKLRKSLLERVGVTVQTGTDGRIAIYQSALLSTPLERQKFLRVAEEIAEGIFESAASLETRDRPHGKEVVEVYRSMGRRGPGNASPVTSDDVNALLSQTVPRRIPGAILKKAQGGSAWMLVLGGFFALVGLFFSFLFSGGLGLLVASLFTLVGVSVAYFSLRYRQGRERLLRDGRCEAFEVKDVQATNVYENNTRQFQVTAFGVPGKISLNVHRDAATLAKQRKAQGKPIKVIVDSADPSKVLWVEAWAIDACVNAVVSG